MFFLPNISATENSLPELVPSQYFQGDSVTIDDTCLIDFGFTAPIDAEHFFALGHLPAGQLLAVTQKLSDNALIGMSEHHVTVFQEWFECELEPDAPFCWFVFSLKPLERGQPCLKIDSFDATVLRHKSGVLINSPIDFGFIKTQINCMRIVDYYAGANASSGKSIQPSDIGADLIDFMPGYCVTGRNSESNDDHLLEWPVADFEIALQYLEKWKMAGAGEVTLNNSGISLESGRLTKSLIKKIRARIRKYGAGMMLSDLLDDQFD